MANLDELIKHLGDDDSSSLTIAGDILGTVADASGAIGAGASVVTEILQMLNVIQPADQQVQDLLSSIQLSIDSIFRALAGDIAAEGILARERDIDGGIKDVAALFTILQTIVPELASLEEDYILQQIQTCVAAIQFFTDYPDKWLIPWASLPKAGPGPNPQGYSDNNWSGALAPPESEFIFNYVYVLPQFLRAIYMSQASILALKPSAMNQSDIQNLFKKAASKLQEVHGTMLSGILGTRLPTAFDVAYQGVSKDLDQWKSPWFGGQHKLIMTYWRDPTLWPFGAVESYSSFNNVTSYVPFMPFEFLPEGRPPVVPVSFVKLVSLRIENCKKTLYEALGLPAVRKTINELRALTGQPVSTALPYEAWSIRNAASILGISPSGGPQLRFITALRALLTSTPPYTGGLLFPAESGATYAPAPLPKSFRSLFAPV